MIPIRLELGGDTFEQEIPFKNVDVSVEYKNGDIVIHIEEIFVNLDYDMIKGIMGARE